MRQDMASRLFALDGAEVVCVATDSPVLEKVGTSYHHGQRTRSGDGDVEALPVKDEAHAARRIRRTCAWTRR